MPPINPNLLRAQATALIEKFHTAPACGVAVRRLLDDYADRAHRLSPRLQANEVSRAYKTPPPVVREIVLALTPPVRHAPSAGLTLAGVIWQGGSLEERLIAAELLGVAAPHQPAEAWALAGRWLTTITTRENAAALGAHGLPPLLLTDPLTYAPALAEWPRHSKWGAVVAAVALTTLARTRDWDDVPFALHTLRGLVAYPDAHVRQAVEEAVLALAEKSPAEVNVFLQDCASLPNPYINQMLRQVLRALPEPLKTDLARTLRLPIPA